MRAGSQHSIKAGSGVPEYCIPGDTRAAAGGGGKGEEGGKWMVMMRLALTGICQVLSQVVFRAINSANH